MNEPLRAIVDYIQTPGTDYALLVTGPWGCGKTHFWKHEVEPELRRKAIESVQHHPLYASFYGCESVKDIDSQLFFSSYKHLREKWIRRLAPNAWNVVRRLVNWFTGHQIPKIDSRWLRFLIRTRDTVICFDDLERTRLPLKEALGYINQFVEHEGVKAIILCNEAEIVGQGAIVPDEHGELYKRIKEKLVGASLTFRPDLDVVFDSLVREHEARTEFHEFIVKNSHLIKELFKKSETHNIRALRRAISALALIVDALRMEGVDPTALAKKLIYVVAPAALELHGRNADPTRLRTILSRDYLAVSCLLFTPSKPPKTDEEKYEEDFARRYLFDPLMSELENAVGCPPILDFLLTGVLDKPPLIEWARKHTKEQDAKEKRHEQFFLDPTSLEDEEFEETRREIFREVDTENISDLGRYVRLFAQIECLAVNGLIAMSREDVYNRFVDGLRKAEEAGTVQPERYFGEVGDPLPTLRSQEGQRFLQEVNRVNKDALMRATDKRIATLLSDHRTNPTEFIAALSHSRDSGFLYVPVFQGIEAGEFAEWIFRLTNAEKRRFHAAVRSRYNSNPLLSVEFAIELPVLERIRKELSSHCEATSGPAEAVTPSNYLIRAIVGELGQAIRKIEDLCGQSETLRSDDSAHRRVKRQDSALEDVVEADRIA